MAKSGASYMRDMHAAIAKTKSDNDGDEPKMTPVSQGHKPNGPHGRAAVRAIGRTKTTGNFKKIEAAKGKGAAIAAYQNKLKAHKAATA